MAWIFALALKSGNLTRLIRSDFLSFKEEEVSFVVTLFELCFVSDQFGIYEGQVVTLSLIGVQGFLFFSYLWVLITSFE